MLLHYKTIGEGPPLIMLHGLFGSSDNWLKTAQNLKDDFSCYIPDLRNHGRSPHDAFMNYESMADDVMSLVGNTGMQKAVLMGHSMGGKLAMHLALNFPDLWRALIVVDIANKDYSLKHINFVNTMRSINFDDMNSRHDVEEHMKKGIDDERVVQMLLKNLEWQSRRRLGWRINLEAIYNNIDAIMQSIQSKNTFDGPALFIRGALSDYVNDGDIIALCKVFPSISASTINDAGHWVQVDNFSDFLKAVRNFCREL